MWSAVPIALAVPAVWSAGSGPNGRDEFQPGVHYAIEAVLDEEIGLLRAAAILTYMNRSPDTLDVLYLHLHLNAFRPNSLWARSERRPEYDFQSLEEPDYAFERLLGASIEGRQLAARFPGAPDSTVVELTLPSPLVPGGEVSRRPSLGVTSVDSLPAPVPGRAPLRLRSVVSPHRRLR